MVTPIVTPTAVSLPPTLDPGTGASEQTLRRRAALDVDDPDRIYTAERVEEIAGVPTVFFTQVMPEEFAEFLAKYPDHKVISYINCSAAMKALADEYLSAQASEAAGCLDPAGIQALFRLHEDPATSAETQVQLDAVINHLLGVQILHRQFIAGDIPQRAQQRAEQLGWRAAA